MDRKGSNLEGLEENINVKHFDWIDDFTSIQGSEGVPVSVTAGCGILNQRTGMSDTIDKTEKLIQEKPS